MGVAEIENNKQHLKSFLLFVLNKLKEYLPIIFSGVVILAILGVVISVVISIGKWLYNLVFGPSSPPPAPTFIEKAIDNPFLAISNIFELANEMIKSISDVVKNILSDYPYLSIVLLIVVIIVINNTTLKRKSFAFLNLFFLLLSIYLFLLLFVFDSESTYKNLSHYMQELHKVMFEENKEISITRTNLLQVLVVSILITINSRFLWILSIFLLKMYVFYIYADDILKYYSTLAKEQQDLFKIAIPITITAPYVLIIWLYRDNDKFLDQDLRQQEIILLKEKINNEKGLGLKQITLAEQDYSMRQSELRSIKQAIENMSIEKKS